MSKWNKVNHHSFTTTFRWLSGSENCFYFKIVSENNLDIICIDMIDYLQYRYQNWSRFATVIDNNWVYLGNQRVVFRGGDINQCRFCSKTSVKCNFTPEIFKSDLGVLLIIFVAYCKNVNRNGNDGMKNGFKIFHTSFQQKFLTSFFRYFYIF